MHGMHTFSNATRTSPQAREKNQVYIYYIYYIYYAYVCHCSKLIPHFFAPAHRCVKYLLSQTVIINLFIEIFIIICLKDLWCQTLLLMYLLKYLLFVSKIYYPKRYYRFIYWNIYYLFEIFMISNVAAWNAYNSLTYKFTGSYSSYYL